MKKSLLHKGEAVCRLMASVKNYGQVLWANCECGWETEKVLSENIENVSLYCAVNGKKK